ncbi:hypothetical protein RRG08_065256 [Elysia crispata]|uniref:Uncharacterized protein n=1 Tax=Elysia crispata TaxID=231223 RepID=A0AAE1DME9_9GAST|nr:hypothetical protein RRG08_065256 [Elysia crispata]
MVRVILYLRDGMSYPLSAGWYELSSICGMVRVILYLWDG